MGLCECCGRTWRLVLLLLLLVSRQRKRYAVWRWRGAVVATHEVGSERGRFGGPRSLLLSRRGDVPSVEEGMYLA